MFREPADRNLLHRNVLREICKEQTMRKLVLALVTVVGIVAANNAIAAEIKVLTAGAFKQVLVAMMPDFEKRNGHKVTVVNDTVGALVKRIEGGETFDVAVLTPAAVDALAKKDRIVPGTRASLAKVGIGVVVKAGAPRPDIATVDAFKRALIEAKSVAYIDPAAGGSSGIYVAQLLDRLGIADQIKPKAKLIPGGAVAEHIARGEAELGVHQISEILPVADVTLVGPLPSDIQNYTIYAAGIGASTAHNDAAKALIAWLAGPEAAAVLKAKGMDPAN
jgi:molybdate transport system substrate-binding protein